MRVYLIRHGETVDNVAGLYAGVRDSALTVHGVEQARLLGEHLVKNDVKLTHIFSSPLSRASKTAEALQKAQNGTAEGRTPNNMLEITKVPNLIEQDFGFYEGKPFYARSDAKKSGREAHHDKHKNDPGFEDVESKESMGKRADAFLDQHFVPLLREQGAESGVEVAVVSHGMLLSNLWRRLLLRLPRKSLTIAPEVTAARGSVVLEHLGGWSNTGYLELAMQKDSHAAKPSTITQEAAETPQAVDAPSLSTPVPPAIATEEVEVSVDMPSPQTKSAARTLAGWSTIILTVDSKQHLVGLKRQRGGIGRIAHDEGQKKLDGFFKRQRTS